MEDLQFFYMKLGLRGPEWTSVQPTRIPSKTHRRHCLLQNSLGLSEKQLWQSQEKYKVQSIQTSSPLTISNNIKSLRISTMHRPVPAIYPNVNPPLYPWPEWGKGTISSLITLYPMQIQKKLEGPITTQRFPSYVQLKVNFTWAKTKTIAFLLASLHQIMISS